MTRDEMQELKRLAESATPGPWAEGLGDMVFAGPVKKARGSVSGGRGIVARTDDDDFDDEQNEANALYIAAAHPQVVLSLIARIEELEAKR